MVKNLNKKEIKYGTQIFRDEYIKGNDNSFNFWYKFYKYGFVLECDFFNKDYESELIKWLNEFEDDYRNRKDKNINNSTIKDSIRGQQNQIKAIKAILVDIQNNKN